MPEHIKIHGHSHKHTLTQSQREPFSPRQRPGTNGRGLITRQLRSPDCPRPPGQMTITETEGSALTDDLRSGMRVRFSGDPI